MIQKTYGTAWERGTVDTNVYERTKTDEADKRQTKEGLSNEVYGVGVLGDKLTS